MRLRRAEGSIAVPHSHRDRSATDQKSSSGSARAPKSKIASKPRKLYGSFAQLRAHGTLQSVGRRNSARMAREIHDELGQSLTAIRSSCLRWSKICLGQAAAVRKESA